MSRLDEVKAALLTCTDRVYHFFAVKADLPYITWSESGRPGFHAGDRREEYSDTGTVHLFTRNEHDPRGIGCELEAVQYESDTGLFHYTWSWEAG